MYVDHISSPAMRHEHIPFLALAGGSVVFALSQGLAGWPKASKNIQQGRSHSTSCFM
jgi:hypothetical protein